MSMIQASALLHQFQRQIEAEGRIVASVDDYQLARHLVRGPLARLLGGQISEAALRFYDRLAEWWRDEFTTTEAAKRDRKSDQAIRSWLRELVSVGAVEQVDPSRGSKPAVWRVTGIDRNDLLAGDCGLPSAEGVRRPVSEGEQYLARLENISLTYQDIEVEELAQRDVPIYGLGQNGPSKGGNGDVMSLQEI